MDAAFLDCIKSIKSSSEKRDAQSEKNGEAIKKIAEAFIASFNK